MLPFLRYDVYISSLQKCCSIPLIESHTLSGSEEEWEVGFCWLWGGPACGVDPPDYLLAQTCPGHGILRVHLLQGDSWLRSNEIKSRSSLPLVVLHSLRGVRFIKGRVLWVVRQRVHLAVRRHRLVQILVASGGVRIGEVEAIVTASSPVLTDKEEDDEWLQDEMKNTHSDGKTPVKESKWF